jgi:hypothetical protein
MQGDNAPDNTIRTLGIPRVVDVVTIEIGVTNRIFGTGSSARCSTNLPRLPDKGNVSDYPQKPDAKIKDSALEARRPTLRW